MQTGGAPDGGFEHIVATTRRAINTDGTAEIYTDVLVAIGHTVNVQSMEIRRLRSEMAEYQTIMRGLLATANAQIAELSSSSATRTLNWMTFPDSTSSPTNRVAPSA